MGIMMHGKRGFTLIELLLVIAILALLLAILLPSLQRARQQAKAVVCRSNIKQWSTAIVTYYIEYEDKMWSDSYPPGASTVPGDWMEILQPYYQDIDEIRCCPVATRPCQDTHSERRGSVDTVWGTPAQQTEVSRAGYWGSYGLNRWSTDPLGDDDRYWKSSSVKAASQIPVILDCIHWHLRPNHTDGIPSKPLLVFSDFPVNGAGGTQIWRCFLDRHNRALNGSFLDGSVQKIALPQLWDLKWHRSFERQNYTYADFPWLR
jgi:prepilin-type N-terminal cleavage/methylation domain-containing protein/prepilin-type processing-associated H-X9-DG protein